MRRLFTATLFLVAGSTQAAMPIGIPDPGFCLTESAPAQPAAWPANVASGFYFIDNTHPAATDTNNEFGTPDKPRRNFPTNLAAGSYVEIHGGPYISSQKTLNVSGTSTAPVWFRGGNADNKVTFQMELIVNGTWAYVENLKFDSDRKTLKVRPKNSLKTDHVCVRDNLFAGPGINSGNTSVLGISGAVDMITEDVVVFRNVIHGYGDASLTTTENDYHGILPSNYSERVWVLNNHVYNLGGDSIQVGQANYSEAQRPNFVYIGFNHFHDNRENAIDVKRANEVIISQNDMHGFRPSTSSSGAALVIHNDARQIWAMYNDVYDSTLGLITTGSTDTYFIGNVIHDIHDNNTTWDPNSGYEMGAAMHFRASTTTGGAINNTLYNYDIGIQLTQGSSYPVVNNIFYKRARADGYDIRVANSEMATNSEFENNLFAQPVHGENLDWNGLQTILQVQNNHAGKCGTCLAVSDPMFGSEAQLDFIIQTGSPAEDKGVAHAIYDQYQSRYGISIKFDKAGNPRGYGNGWDIGAYETVSALPRPDAPKNLRLVQ